MGGDIVAKNKVIEPSDALNQLIDVVNRMGTTSIECKDNVLICHVKNDKIVMIIVDDKLMELVKESENIDTSTELSKSNERWFQYRDLGDDWIDLTTDDKLYTGKHFEITPDGYEFPIIITKDIMPIRLKKAEYKMIDYKIFNDPKVFAIRKRFQLLDDYGFTILRLLKII